MASGCFAGSVLKINLALGSMNLRMSQAEPTRSISGRGRVSHVLSMNFFVASFARAVADLLAQALQSLVVLWLVRKQVGGRFQRKRPALFQLSPEVDSRSAFLCGQSVKQKKPFIGSNHGGRLLNVIDIST